MIINSVQKIPLPLCLLAFAIILLKFEGTNFSVFFLTWSECSQSVKILQEAKTDNIGSKKALALHAAAIAVISVQILSITFGTLNTTRGHVLCIPIDVLVIYNTAKDSFINNAYKIPKIHLPPKCLLPSLIIRRVLPLTSPLG